VFTVAADEARGNYKQALRIHSEAYETIVAVMESRILWNMVSPERRSQLPLFQFLYCPHLQRSFPSAADLQTVRISEFGFDCDPHVLDPVPSQVRGEVCARVAAAVGALLPSLLPRPDFEAVRESAAAKLQLALLTEGAIPLGTQVALFGSSHNSFGSEGADLDTTLLFPSNIQVNPEDKPIIIERLGVVLEKIGMTHLSVRSTARIPIVIFRDPLHGTYAASPRPLGVFMSLTVRLCFKRSGVRHLAAQPARRGEHEAPPRLRRHRSARACAGVRHQVLGQAETPQLPERRHAEQLRLHPVSDPLSSGNLPCVVPVLARAITTISYCVFLDIQNRPIPLVPNLQTLPPTWSGSRQEIPSEAPTSAGFHNDAFIGPHQPSIHLQQQLLHTQQSQQQQEDRNVLPKVYVHSADGVRCNAYFYTPTSAQPDLLSVCHHLYLYAHLTPHSGDRFCCRLSHCSPRLTRARTRKQ
jgi:hypothetical protein